MRRFFTWLLQEEDDLQRMDHRHGDPLVAFLSFALPLLMLLWLVHGRVSP